MNRIYVALDLETTGLDPERDAIMEIGAVRFRTSLDYGSIQAKVLDTWSTLVNPGRPIPIQVQQLTGIRQDEVDHAPRFSQILNDLRRFVGGYAVVGHNVQFDLRFLRTHGLSLSNPALDTFELAGILAPHSDRYSLTRLGQDFGLRTAATTAPWTTPWPPRISLWPSWATPPSCPGRSCKRSAAWPPRWIGR